MCHANRPDSPPRCVSAVRQAFGHIQVLPWAVRAASFRTVRFVRVRSGHARDARAPIQPAR
ncbi:hypothetical protein FRAHR75_720028 [Frankia sp. Hr75.2]|nr:hypothetical protein FRAHR75_720028 [Frankia sp. Hr75.2]